MAYALVIAGKGGKRSLLAREVGEALAGRGLRVGGFTQRTLEAEPGKKSIEAERLRDGSTVLLARTAPAADGQGLACSLVFDPTALAEARRWIADDAASAEVLVVDGVGKLELGGQGNREAVADALGAGPLVVLAVRDDQLSYVLEAFGLEEEPVAAYGEGEPPDALEAFVAEVARAARGAATAR